MKHNNEPKINIPTILLPKASGSSTKVSEQFEPDLCSGGGHYSYTLDITQARALTPEVKIQYSSQYGATCFGNGFCLPFDEIKRKTSHGVPTYNDDSDTFIFSGGNLIRTQENDVVENGWTKRTYQPQTMHSFLWIEYWRKNRVEDNNQQKSKNEQDFCTTSSSESYWVVKYPDGFNEKYGSNPNAQLADPDSLNQRVYSWLLSERWDAKKNHVLFNYGQIAHEHGKGIEAYLASIQYGSYLVNVSSPDQQLAYAFKISLEYYKEEEKNNDIIYSFRSGFPITVSQLCEKITLTHQSVSNASEFFTVRQWCFDYDVDQYSHRAFLKSIKKLGMRKNDVQYAPDITFSYQQLKLPVAFTRYFQLYEANPARSEQKESLKGEDVLNVSIMEKAEKADRQLNIGNLSTYQFVDLYGEGLPGILYSNTLTTYFWRNKGEGCFAPAEAVFAVPRGATLNGHQSQLINLFGDQKLEWIISRGGQVGYYTLEREGKFDHYRRLEAYPHQYNSQDAEFLDLEGDGKIGILVWGRTPKYYPSNGPAGFGHSKEITLADSTFPPGVASRGDGIWIGFVDMFGDQLLHRVFIRNGQVDCWPNRGNCHFGQKMSMTIPSKFTKNEADFSKKRLFLADIAGSGRLDLVYLQRDTLDIYFNQGASFSEATSIVLPEPYSNLDNIHFVDILGKGSSCFIFSKGGYHPKHYFYDFAKEGKPFLLTSIDNGIGLKTEIKYQSSIVTYLKDMQSNGVFFHQRSLQNKLHFPVSVISEIVLHDEINQHSYSQRYAFHGGYFDTVEKEFVGFGLVEYWDAINDTETLDSETAVAYSRTWFHVGDASEQLLSSQEYFKHENPIEFKFPKNGGLLEQEIVDVEQKRKAHYALRKKVIHEEIYDNKDRTFPYKLSHFSFNVILNKNNGKSFFVQAQENITFDYEKEVDDPKIYREIFIRYDFYNYLTAQVDIYYSKKLNSINFLLNQNNIEIPTNKEAIQAFLWESHFYHSDVVGDYHYLGNLTETRKYQLKNLDAEDISHASSNFENKDKILAHKKYFYWNKVPNDNPSTFNLTTSLPPRLHHIKTAIIEKNAYSSDVNKIEIEEESFINAGYYQQEESSFWWGCSLIQTYDNTYYLPSDIGFFINQHDHPLYSYTTIQYDSWHMRITQIERYRYEAESKVVSIVKAIYDPYSLMPHEITDENENITSAIYTPLGMLAAVAQYGQVTVEDVNYRQGDDAAVFATASINYNAQMDVILKNPQAFLFGSSTIYYGFLKDNLINSVLEISRTRNQAELPFLHETNTHEEFHKIKINYYDGMGRVVQTKQRVQAFTSDGKFSSWKWIVSGHTKYNQKGLPICKSLPRDSNLYIYEPRNVGNQFPFIRTEYDALNRPIRVINADNSSSAIERHAWWILYLDENYQKVTSLNKQPTTIKIEILNARGNIAKEVMLLSKRDEQPATFDFICKSIDYDAAGRAIHYYMSQPRNSQDSVVHTTFLYDLLGRIIKEKGNDQGETINFYSAFGLLMKQWNSRHIIKIMHYDQWHRLIKTEVKEGEADLRTVEERTYGDSQLRDAGVFSLNKNGKLVEVRDQVGVVTFDQFDIRGFCLKKTRQFRESMFISCAMRYDIDGLLREKKFQNGSILIHYYNTLNQLISIDFKASKDVEVMSILKDITYHPHGQRREVAYGNQLTTTYAYDDKRLRLLNLRTKHTDTKKTVQDIDYEYDFVGNINCIKDRSLAEIEQFNLVNDANDVTTTYNYDYDDCYRLVKATESSIQLVQSFPEGEKKAENKKVMASSNTHSFFYKNTSSSTTVMAKRLQRIEDFCYDENDNLVKYVLAEGNDSAGQSLLTEKIFHIKEATHQINYINEPANCCAYDPQGNLLSSTIDGEEQQFHWNYNNCLSEVNNLKHNYKEYYYYDYENRRAVCHTENADLNSQKIQVSFDQWDYHKTFDFSQAVEKIAITIWDNGHCIATYSINDNGASESHALTYHLTNHLKSVALDVDDSGNFVSYEAYAPFGHTTLLVSPDSAYDEQKRFRYTGKEKDQKTGLYYYGARYYSPSLFRWISPDPAGFIDGLNLYAYVKNNPIKFIDPTGMFLVATYTCTNNGRNDVFSLNFNEKTEKFINPIDTKDFSDPAASFLNKSSGFLIGGAATSLHFERLSPSLGHNTRAGLVPLYPDRFVGATRPIQDFDMNFFNKANRLKFIADGRRKGILRSTGDSQETYYLKVGRNNSEYIRMDLKVMDQKKIDTLWNGLGDRNGVLDQVSIGNSSIKVAPLKWLHDYKEIRPEQQAKDWNDKGALFRLYKAQNAGSGR